MTDDMLTNSRAPTRLWTPTRFRSLPPLRPPTPHRRNVRERGLRRCRIQTWRIRHDRLPVAGHGYDPELLVGRVVTHLNDHLADPNLDLNQLADAAHVSPSSLGRAFRDVLDTTPWRYVMRRRVDHAKRLLADTDRPLADIALDAGFYDQAHFSRTFKRFTGTTPGTFRENNCDMNREEDTEEKTKELDLVLEECEA